MKKFRLKSMDPKQILVYIVFLIAVVWTLKFIFELSVGGGKICYLPSTYFEGEKFTGKYEKKYKEKSKTQYGPASSFCVEGGNLNAYLKCEYTSAYNNAYKKYDKCIASGGKDTLELSMGSCSGRSVDVEKEIRGEWYKDCMKEKGW